MKRIYLLAIIALLLVVDWWRKLNGLKLVDIRAKAMQKASDENPGRMVSVTGLTKEEIETLLKSVRAFCKDVEMSIACHLYAKGFVLAGEKKAIDCLQRIPHKGKVSPLAVSGAFHTSLMKSAEPDLSQALESMDLRTPEIKVYSNVTGKPYKSSEDIKRLLPRQLVEPVQWHKIMKDICDIKYEQTFYEVGPGRQLTTILAKTDRRLLQKCKNIKM